MQMISSSKRVQLTTMCILNATTQSCEEDWNDKHEWWTKYHWTSRMMKWYSKVERENARLNGTLNVSTTAVSNAISKPVPKLDYDQNSWTQVCKNPHTRLYVQAMYMITSLGANEILQRAVAYGVRFTVKSTLTTRFFSFSRRCNYHSDSKLSKLSKFKNDSTCTNFSFHRYIVLELETRVFWVTDSLLHFFTSGNDE